MWNNLEFNEWLNYIEVIQDIAMEASSIRVCLNGPLGSEKHKLRQRTGFHFFQRE